MDTRIKIISLEAARELSAPLAVATGHFDVLRAESVRELDSLRRSAPGARLLAFILPLATAVLDDRARAELAAALRTVDYVAMASDAEAAALLEALKPAAVLRMEAADARLIRELREHVRGRQTR